MRQRLSSPPTYLLVIPRHGAPPELWRDALGLEPEWRVAREGELMAGWQYERIVVAPLPVTGSEVEAEMRRQWLNNLSTKMPPGNAIVYL